ncbi:MAG: DNRLRE domain-containing protein, partial [Caldilineales bacterium]|nr:DNRLRE domain-containing protein [Caldilineales bacterium]
DGLHAVAAGVGGVLLITGDGGATWSAKTGQIGAAALHGLHLFGNEVWAVGDSGWLYHSPDLGASWAPRSAAGFPMTNVLFAPGQNLIGWVAGPNGRIGYTTDGGHSWARRSGEEPGYHLYALAASDAGHVWTGGAVLAPNYGNWDSSQPPRLSWFVWGSNDGRIWRRVIGGLYPWYYNLTAASESILYVVGHDLHGLKSVDGGETWRELYEEFRTDPNTPLGSHAGAGEILHGVACAPANPDDCHASGRSAKLLHTTNGGDSWALSYVSGYTGSLYDVARAPSGGGVTVGRWANFHSAAGQNWQAAWDNWNGATGSKITHIDVDMVSDSQAAASMLKPGFRYTTNGGQSWRLQTLPADYSSWFLAGVDALDRDGDGGIDSAWLAGCARAPGGWVHEAPCTAGAILYNSDPFANPANWQPLLQDPAVPRLLRISMVDESSGWAAGYDGAILFTEDSGATWTRQPVDADDEISGLAVVSRSLAFAAGREGVVLRYSQPDRRLTAGAQWRHTIDGDLGEWTPAFLRRISAEDADGVSGPLPSGPADLSADVRLRWDDLALYLGVYVHDDQILPGDYVDIFLDGAPVAAGAAAHPLRFTAQGSVSSDGGPLPEGWLAAVLPQADGYSFEAAIPAAALGGEFAHLRKLAVNLALADADSGQEPTTLLWAGEDLTGQAAAVGELTLFQFDRRQPQAPALPAGAMNIDGDLGEWDAAGALALSRAAADSVQGDPPADDADLSAGLRLRWWPQMLFFAFEVADADITAGDRLFLTLDPSGDARPGPDDLTIEIWPDGFVTLNGAEPQGLLAAAQPTAAGYRLELALSAALLGRSLTAGQPLPFNVALADDDDGDGEPETWLNWQGASVGGIQADYGAALPAPLETFVKVTRHDPRVQDTFISAWHPANNYGLDQELALRPGPVRASLFRFDLSAIPAGALVSKAYLALYTTVQPGTFTGRIYRMLRPWSEMQANWNQAAAGQPWAAPGGQAAVDRAAAPSAEITLAGVNQASWFDVTADV